MKKLFAIFFCIGLVSCQLSEEEKIKVEQLKQELPAQNAENVDVIYSEEGEIKLKLKAPSMIMSDNNKEQFNEFPDGLEMIFFDKQGQENARLTALYGYDNQRKRERFVKDSVKITDYKDGWIYTTQELYIDEKTDSVHNNNQYVKITKPDGTLLQGTGFISNTRMDDIRINKVTNSIMIVEEEMMENQVGATNEPEKEIEE